MNKFYNQNVFITGAGIGIGFGMARKFAKEGAIVGLNDVNEHVANKAAKKINAEIKKERVYPYAFDVSDVEEMQNSISSFAKEHKGIHIFVANAGITNYGSFLNYTQENFSRLMEVNIKGSYFSAQAGARAMVRFKIPGRIIFISSVTGIQAHPNLSAYGATKAAIMMMAKGLAVELGVSGIAVNAIAAGATITERTLQDDPNYENNWNKVAANGKTGSVDDIVGTCMFLSSQEAQHITGTTIVVDGGWSIQSPIPGDHPQV